MTVHAPLAAARALRPLIETHAHSDATPVDHEVVAALAEHDLYGVLVPKELGGLELSIEDALDVVEEISYADGSTGWTYMACATTSGFFGAWCDDEFVGTAFSDGIPLIAGQLAPNGQGQRVDGGYLVTGQYQFGSGIDHAEYVGMGFIAPDSNDAPEYRMGVVAKDAVRLAPNWDVLGLRATASHDYVADAVFVPEAASFGYAAPGALSPQHRRGGPQFDLGVLVLTCIGHAGWAIGITRRALDEVRALAPAKHRMGSTTRLSESERFLHDFARLEQRARAASGRVHRLFAEAEEAAAEGVATAALSAEVRSATAYVTEEAAEIVRACYLMAGTTGLRSGPLERGFRDIHAGTQHAMVNPQHHVAWAQALLDEG